MIALTIALSVAAVALYLASSRLERRAYKAWLADHRSPTSGRIVLRSYALRLLSAVSVLGALACALCLLARGAS